MPSQLSYTTPRYMLFNDLIKEINKKFKSKGLGSTRHRNFKDFIASYPELVLHGILIDLNGIWYVDKAFSMSENGVKAYRNLFFQYHQFIYYHNELDRTKRHIRKAIQKLNIARSAHIEETIKNPETKNKCQS
jgi:hypothetical protein